MSSSLTKKTMGGFFWLGGVKAVNVIFQFAILAILARLLSPSEFGLIGLALIVVSFSEIFNDMGFGPAVTQKKELSQTDYSTAFWGSIGFGVIIVSVVQLFAHQLAIFFKNDSLELILRVISVVILFNSIKTVPLGYMYREMQYKKLSLIQIASYVLGYGAVGITLAYLDYGVWSLVYAVIAHTFLSLVLYFFLSKKKPGFSINWQSFKLLLNFGGGYSLTKLFSFIANRGDKIVIGRILGIEALGLYERSYQIVRQSSAMIGEVIDKALFSPIARKQHKRNIIAEIYLDMTYIFAIVFLPLSAFIYLNSGNLIGILLGDNWGQATPIAEGFSFMVFFVIATRISSTIANSLGDVYRRAIRTFIYACLVIGSSYFFSSYGLIAVAYAISICKVVDYILAYLQVKSLTKAGVTAFISSHFLGIFLLIIYVLLEKIVQYSFEGLLKNSFLSLLISVVILIVVYLAGVFLDPKKVLRKYLSVFI